MKITITGKYMTKETAKFLGLPFTTRTFASVYRFVEGGTRIERVCFKSGRDSTRALYVSEMEKLIWDLLEQLNEVQLVEIEEEPINSD